MMTEYAPTIRRVPADANRPEHYMIDDVLVWIEPNGVLLCGSPYHYGAADCKHVIAIKASGAH